jgi:DNA-binding MarR family transcriptional regulator
MGNISEDIRSSFASNKVKALINIKYTAGWINSKETELFKSFDISPQQYNILRILRGAAKPMQVQTVKDRMIERAPNATRLMDKLCDKKLINRVRCEEDRRVVFVEITDTGLQILKQIDDKGVPDFLQKITEEEAKIVSDILDKIR